MGRHRKKGASESQKKRSHQKLAMLELDLGVKTEEINVCCHSHLICCILLWQPEQTNTEPSQRMFPEQQRVAKQVGTPTRYGEALLGGRVSGAHRDPQGGTRLPQTPDPHHQRERGDQRLQKWVLRDPHPDREG